MSRPLLISDCDDVLLHMVPHFAAWLEEAQGCTFVLDESGLGGAVRDRETGAPVPREEVGALLDDFFISEMHRQNLVAGAIEALAEIEKLADVVILTNLRDEHHAIRVSQLGAFDIRYEVLCNQGGKGPPVRELVDRFQPSATVFVDDWAFHHESVAEHAPEVWRLHMVADSTIAEHVPAAPHAHARIDRWSEATRWIVARLGEGPAAR
jgi:hypothetical protein